MITSVHGTGPAILISPIRKEIATIFSNGSISEDKERDCIVVNHMNIADRIFREA